MKVAIPHLGNNVAPCFEAATSFLIIVIENNQKISSQIVTCNAPEGHKRIRLLTIHRVDLLICSGIKGLYQDMLSASGINVIKNVSGSVDDAIEKLIFRKLSPETPSLDELQSSSAIPHRQMVEWACQLFRKHGYKVSRLQDGDLLLVDLVAEINCPVCNKNIRIAICCGLQTYRPSQEISEFHHATSSGFNARVYVCPSNPAVRKYCREYNIEHLDPESDTPLDRTARKDTLPIIGGPVQDHEKLSILGNET